MKRSRLSLLLALIALTSAAQAADQVPLKLELPKPLFAGTPRPIQLPNLEKPRSGKRPDLMVPAGTVNLSKGKTVTSSDPLPVIGELTFLTDGDKSGTDGTYVELGPTPQWVQIDLGASAKVAAAPDKPRLAHHTIQHKGILCTAPAYNDLAAILITLCFFACH